MLNDGKVSRAERRGDLVWKVELKIQGDCRTEEVVYVDYLISHMERKQGEPSGCQHPPKLHHYTAELVGTKMHNGIESNNTPKAGIGNFEITHVTNAKLDGGIEAGSDSDHLRGEIDAEDLNALLVEIARNMSGPAAEITDQTAITCFFRESIQQVPVERLTIKFTGEMLRVRGSG
jgi:hypothetical protein